MHSIPLDLVSGTEIMSPTDITRGANRVLNDLGYEQVRALDEVYVRMSTPDAVHRLRLRPRTPPVAMHVVTGVHRRRPTRPRRGQHSAGDRPAIVYERVLPPKAADE
ncbi:MAG: hypothetical protein ACRDRH_23010 [Pseudonocardia sp.]